MTLCTSCANINFSKDEEYDSQRLGQWQELLVRAKEGCNGCQFFINLLTFHVESHGLSDIPDFFKQREASTRRRYGGGAEVDPEIHKDEVWISGSRVLYKPAAMVAADGSIYTCDDLCLETCTLVPDQSSGLDYKRDLSVSPDVQACYDLVKSWVADCDAHGCQPQGDVPMPKRVIEVAAQPESPCKLIDSSGILGKYAALSHRWGDVEVTKLTQQNVSKFMNQLPVEQLSRNCRDAITIARALGIQYLWIDALCIIQDDPSDKSTEMTSMHGYYSNCALLISADIAEHADSGILQDRYTQYSPPLGPNRDQCFRPAYLTWLDAVTYSHLSQRAYAIQERVLAPRILHYTRRQMMWECAHGWKLEGAREIDKKMGAGQPRYNKALVQPLLSQTRTTDPLVDHEKTAKLLDAWYKSVQEFSASELTFPSDKLLAISGVASALDDGSLGEYFAGTWTRAIECSLGWSRTFPLLTKPTEYRAPSWSWASLDGSISIHPPENLLEHLNSPSPWMQSHGPKVLESHIVRDDEDGSSSYFGFLPGSYIKLEAECMGINKMLNLPEVFHPTLVLDTSNAFDCHCCRPDPDVVDTTGEPAEKIMNTICMLAQGEAWTHDKSKAMIVLLHPVRDHEGTYERVGMMSLAFDWPDNDGRFKPEYQGKTVEEEFWQLGWEKKVLKLI